MTKITTVLFDFDGVVADTESQYDIFWGKAAEHYRLGIDNFSHVIKGTTLGNIFEKYFSDFPAEEYQKIVAAIASFESQMEYAEIPGSIAFIRLLKDRGMNVGLVTSSDDTKISKAFDVLGLDGVFDTIVTANRISKGKPDPMCYLLGAADLHAEPSECIVFEDAFTGIQAGTAAGMRVVGLSTTNSAASLADKVYAVIPDFKDTARVLELLK